MGPRGVPHGPQGAVSQRALRGDTMGPQGATPWDRLQFCSYARRSRALKNQCKTVNGPMAPDLEFCAVPLKVLWHRPLRSEMQPPRGPGGANFETKSFKFR